MSKREPMMAGQMGKGRKPYIREGEQVWSDNTGKAPPPRFAHSTPPKVDPKATGPCSSCGRAGGKQMAIPGHGGIPMLCESCAEKRRARIAANRSGNAALKATK